LHARHVPVIDLVYFNAGGGHRATAQAIDAVLREQKRPWTIRLVNLAQVLDPKDAFRRVAGFAPEEVYNHRLRRGWTFGLAQELRLLQFLIRIAHPMLVRRLRRHWSFTQPDMVVSLIPNFNRALCDSLRSVLPHVPYVTVLTDFADLPPRFWIERGLPQQLVCGTDRAVAQARAMGHPDERIHVTSGMVVRPEFYRETVVDRKAEHRRLGLDPSRTTGIVLFGGHGSKAMLSVARRLPDIQLILACGHNKVLQQQLAEVSSRAPHCVLGYTDDIARYMRLADFFIGKPGPGSVSEALQLGLPVVVVRNAWTMPQERYNAEWVMEHDVGVVHDTYRTIDVAVSRLIERLGDLTANVGRLRNRAVFEVPEILADILHQAACAAATQGSVGDGLAADQAALATGAPAG